MELSIDTSLEVYHRDGYLRLDDVFSLDEMKAVSQAFAEPETLKEFDERFERVLFEGKAGTVWLLNAGLLHASPKNGSNQIRELVANVFRTTDNRPFHPRPQEYLAEPGQEAL